MNKLINISQRERYALLEMVLGLDARGIPLESKITEEMLPSRDQTVRSKTHAELCGISLLK